MIWQPMKDAPRDGQAILLRVKGHVISAKFDPDDYRWVNGFFGIEVGPEVRGSAPDGWMWIPEDAPKE